MADRSIDWLRQAKADLEHAKLSAREQDFEWSCFAAQQAAEKAIKAVYYSHHGDPWRHSLLALLQMFPEDIANSKDFVRLARWGDWEDYKASNPAVSPDGKWAAFQSARSKDEAGVGYGIFLLRLK